MPASCGFAKYLIVAVSDDLCYVFGKADGAFLGKVKNEETLGNGYAYRRDDQDR